MKAGRLRMVEVGGLEWATERFTDRVWRAARPHTVLLSDAEVRAGLQYVVWARTEERLAAVLEQQAELARGLLL